MVIFLLGYMASGKSTIGKILARNLQYTFIDLDSYIEQNENHSISEIFKFKGEIHFRNVESNYLNKLMNEHNNIVLALGGGTPCYGENMSKILNAKNSTSIYLKASVETLIKRLENEKTKRPLISHLKSKNELTEFVAKHLFERSGFYNRAKMIINTDYKDEKGIVEDIVLKLF